MPEHRTLELSGQQAAALHRYLTTAGDRFELRLWQQPNGDLFVIGADTGLLAVTCSGDLPTEIALPQQPSSLRADLLAIVDDARENRGDWLWALEEFADRLGEQPSSAASAGQQADPGPDFWGEGR